MYAAYAMQVSQRASYMLSPPTIHCDYLLENYDQRTLESFTIFETLDQTMQYEEDANKLQVAINEHISFTGS